MLDSINKEKKSSFLNKNLKKQQCLNSDISLIYNNNHKKVFVER